MNEMTKVSNRAVSHHTGCETYVVDWFQETLAGNTSKANAAAFFSESCGEHARSIYKDTQNEARRLRNREPQSPRKEAFLQATLDYVAVYQSKGRDFDDIYAMPKTASDREEPFGPLANEVNALLDKGMDRVDPAFEALEKASSDYRSDSR